VLSRPTFEDAPVDVHSWSGQRTRWFKGWLQTWLVMMRRPGRLVSEMGPFPALVFQVLVGGLLLSSLAHPLVLGYLAAALWLLLMQGAYTPGPLGLTLFVIDMINIFGSYAIFIALGRAPMSNSERSAIGWRWFFVAPYWLLISTAAWRAIHELRNNPFLWNKTTHRPASKTPQAGEIAGNS
jgi:cellulose synthase/poly-beta-1,6-N-acetylglucosamine synthase-like glycosyltransferase